MSDDNLRGAKLKLDRAIHHIDDVKDAILRFAQSKPYFIFEDFDAEAREYVIKAGLKRELPGELFTISGDAIHNLRTALDYLACVLAQERGIVNVDGIYFPTGRWQDAKMDAGRWGKIQKLGTRAICLLDDLNTSSIWRRDNRVLHVLDLTDKHRSLLPIGRAGHGFTISGTFSGSAKIGIGEAPGWKSANEDIVLARRGVDSHAQYEIEPTVNVSFGDVQGIGVGPMVEVLERLRGFVGYTLTIFEKRVFGLGKVRPNRKIGTVVF